MNTFALTKVFALPRHAAEGFERGTIRLKNKTSPYKSICLAAACGGKVVRWAICFITKNLNLPGHAAEGLWGDIAFEAVSI
ncbi:hypothetical protein [Sphingobacterium deserti]|uniref:Uncharacterized protein n=1 Tax=Sphingobacterium deserti TaxID=1229276 RepID=A0A0B8T7Z1_9SPHI|nr:hypothetical protein [Sphingobacterium deserti]KGE13965.1 hypothetical protein DI53_2159 [Sphingobacterium deserti]